MRLRNISIKNRLNISFGICMAFIVLLCLVGYNSTIKVDMKTNEAIRITEGTGPAQHQKMTAEIKEILNINRETRLYLLMLGIVSMFFGITSSLFVRRSITAPIKTITYLTSRLAEGDLTMDSRLTRETKDEFNDVKKALLLVNGKPL